MKIKLEIDMEGQFDAPKGFAQLSNCLMEINPGDSVKLTGRIDRQWWEDKNGSELLTQKSGKIRVDYLHRIASRASLLVEMLEHTKQLSNNKTGVSLEFLEKAIAAIRQDASDAINAKALPSEPAPSVELHPFQRKAREGVL